MGHADAAIEEQLDLEAVAIGRAELRDVLPRDGEAIVELVPAHRAAFFGVKVVEERRNPRGGEMARQGLGEFARASQGRSKPVRADEDPSVAPLVKDHLLTVRKVTSSKPSSSRLRTVPPAGSVGCN